jgi:hypothetical protein
VILLLSEWWCIGLKKKKKRVKKKEKEKEKKRSIFNVESVRSFDPPT